MSFFAVLAVALAAMGIYGVLAYSVLERRHELAIRMALGARRGHVARLMLRRPCAMTGAGIALGVAGTLVAGPVLASLLVGVSPRDPRLLLEIAALLAAVAACAGTFPLWRATRTDRSSSSGKTDCPLATGPQGPENTSVSESSALFMPAIVVGAVYAFYVAVAAREAAGRRRRHAMLAAASSAMGNAAADPAAGTVTGVVSGLPTTFCLRGGAAHVEVATPPVDLLVAIQPRLSPPRATHEPGAVPTGDPIFDDAFFVEGAPADVVRCLLGSELRAHLLTLRPLTLTIEGSAVELRGLATISPAEACQLIVVAAEAAAAIPGAIAEADGQLTVVTGSPYRPTVDATAVHDARAARAEEMAGFLEVIRDRAIAARRALVLAAVLGAILVISLYASGS